MNEQPTPETMLTGELELAFDDEDIQLQVKSHPYLVRIDGTGWLDRKDVVKLRDWLNKVLGE